MKNRHASKECVSDGSRVGLRSPLSSVRLSRRDNAAGLPFFALTSPRGACARAAVLSEQVHQTNNGHTLRFALWRRHRALVVNLSDYTRFLDESPRLFEVSLTGLKERRPADLKVAP